ncbi:hypothetical protein [Pandoraea soli]|nr:hypothetical protein [Pandoraea soli]
MDEAFLLSASARNPRTTVSFADCVRLMRNNATRNAGAIEAGSGVPLVSG